MTDKRGLVISNPIVLGADGSFFMKTSVLDPQELRFSLLFWDVLDFPTNNLIRISGQEDSFLVSAGVMQRTNMSTGGLRGDFGSIMRECHVGAYRRLDKGEPGVWSLATGERSISFASQDLDAGRGVLVQLHRAIPIPNEDVPLQDVLEFRTRRRDELLALRMHVESVYQRIAFSGDGQLAWNSEVAALEKSAADHIKASKEAGFRLRWTSFEASLNVPSGVVAAGFAFSQGLPLLNAIGVGAVASIGLKGGAALKRREVSATPFRYVSQFHEELFPGS